MSATEKKKAHEAITKEGLQTASVHNDLEHDNEGTSAQNGSFQSGVTIASFKNETSSQATIPVTDDESSNSGFIVIKPSAGVIESDLEKKEDEEGNETQNVIVIENSSELSLDGLDADVLSQVQRLLEESGMEHSVTIVNEAGNENTNNEASYIIDLNPDVKSHISSINNSKDSKTLSLTPHSTSEVSLSTIPSSKPETSSISEQCTPTEISSHENEQASSLSLSGASSTNVDCLVMSSSSGITDAASYSVSSNAVRKDEFNDTIDPCSIVSVDCSASTIHSPQNLIIQNTSSQHQVKSTESTDKHISATSHVAEQLLNIAKKMIGEGGAVSQRISMNESISKIVISPEQKASGEKNSDSVITMYLSSPNELKSKLEKFKTDSPVIIVQAGEEPLTEEEEEVDDKKTVLSPQENQTQATKADISIKPGYSKSVSELNTLKVNESMPQSKTESQDATDSVVYSCSECGYSSQNKHYYKQHVDLVHNEYRPYKCPHCDYAGKRRHALFEHMVVHSDIRPYVCGHCKADFRKKSHLTSHIKLHTSHHRLVQCGVCNIQLPDVEAFESHLRKIHNTDKLYKCKLCDHTVVDRQSMLNHLSSHNESIIFSCPNCSSYFNEEESLIDHLKNVHNVVKVSDKVFSTSHDSNMSSFNVSERPIMSSTTISTTTTNDSNPAQKAKIVCTECGFMCTDSQVMKKHMWVHINSSSEMNVQIKGQTPSTNNGASSSNAMGVLKMNVVSGLKTLPDNVVYQCTSCNFNSSDNSAFIKHMLLHKTQRKNHPPTTSKPEMLADADEVRSLDSSDRAQRKTISVLSNISQPGANNVSTEKLSNIPFVFDQASGRYRCLICGYHCDYQRTVKAHIWKHSGHQNIEYPVFDQTKKVEMATSNTSAATGNVEVQSKTNPGSFTPLSTTTSKASPLPGLQRPLLKSNPQDITLVPVDSCSGSYKLGEVLFFNGNTLCVSENSKMDHLSNQFENSQIDLAPVKNENVMCEDSSDFAGNVRTLLAEQEIKDEKPQIIPGKISKLPMNEDKIQAPKSKASVKNLLQEEGNTEPNVVVEIMDTVPSGLGLTGLKSQQGSPRVSDLESSAGEIKLSAALKEALSHEKNTVDSPSSFVQQQEPSVEKKKYNLRRSKDPKKSGDQSGSEQVTNKAIEENIVEGKDVKPAKTVSELKKKASKKSKVDEEVENLINTESDTTESSDEVGSTGEPGSSSSHPPKTGICSSLLAVIEQLRERSRTEGDKVVSPNKELPKRSTKRNKKYGIHTDMVPLSEFQNIEKINAGDSETYRCSLCHYTSQKIWNLKFHMKTHRQKKPSECSLCDFSSTTPEALQEHMLQHCKVRTYACKFCPQSFNHKSSLRAHMRAHKDKEPNFCPYCVFETSNVAEFKEHMMVHSGCSSRLRCPVCDHIMNSKEELTAHVIKCTAGNADTSSASTVEENKETEVKKNQELVETSASDSNNGVQVTAATKTAMATEHACVVSGCSFTSFSLKELQEHLSVHCNPSLLVCELCDFKALHSRSLKSHMKRHANDQRYVQQPLEQYKCNLCGYVCHHLPSLKSHMWRHASDESYSYEFTNDVINAAIDHDSRVDANGAEADDPELLDRVINSERRIMEGELTKSGKGDGQRPVCWVTFRCCSCGFETINKAKLNIHMRTHPEIIKQALEGFPSKPTPEKSSNVSAAATTVVAHTKTTKRVFVEEQPFVPPKVKKNL